MNFEVMSKGIMRVFLSPLTMNKYSYYFDKDLNYLLKEEEQYFPAHTAMRHAKSRLRMYANLFTRSIRSSLITEDSTCVICGDYEFLHLDHIVPISKGGVNTIKNIQVLCRKCNLKKKDKL